MDELITKNELGRLLCAVGFLIAMHLEPPNDVDRPFLESCDADIQKLIERLSKSDGT